MAWDYLSNGLSNKICQKPLLGKTSNEVFSCRSPHKICPVQTPVEGTNGPSAIHSICQEGLSRASLHAILWNAAVSMALIMAPLSTIAKNQTFSPCGLCRIGTVKNRSLVFVRIAFPDASTI